MPDSTVLSIEKLLARAHLALWRAAVEAETLRDQGLSEDLYALTSEVGRINVFLLTGANPRRRTSPTV